MKKLKSEIDGELHEIKIKKRSRVVKDKKKGGVRLKAWTKKKRLRALLPVCMLAIMILGVFTLGSLGNREINDVDLGFVTVSYPVPTDGSTPDSHTGIENIGYMNTRLRGQTNWYSEMHSKVSTIVPQTVDTFKQYSNGILIQSDIAKSSLINDAQQFCFIGDDVLWRTGSGSVSSWNGIDTPWKTGTPAGHMKVDDFKKRVGLPGTEFSVYVLREDTILDADPVVVNEDGTYAQTFYLNTSPDKATMYYVNQMVFKGGLASPPSFDYITVTYTFDATWQVLVCEVEEKYTATKQGIPVPASCVSTSRTEYEYGTEKAVHTAYENYFKNYVDVPVIGEPEDNGLTAVDCLGAAFASVLTEPTTFAVSLDLNGKRLDGAVYLDVNKMDIRAVFGNILLYYGNDGICLSLGDGIKIKTDLEELMRLIGQFAPAQNGEMEAFSLDLDGILADLVKNDLQVGDGEAKLHAELSLFGIDVPIDFRFVIGENNAVSLGDVQTKISIGDFVVGAKLEFGDREIPALTDAEKSNYVGVVSYVEKLLPLFNAENYSVAVNYAGEAFSVSGEIMLSFQNGIRATGALSLTVGENVLPLSFGFESGIVYVNLSGIKVSGSMEEIRSLLDGLLPETDMGSGVGLEIGALLETVLSDGFFDNIALTEDDGILTITAKGTELLKAFGIDFDLGEVTVSVTDSGLCAKALGAEITLAEGSDFEVEKEGYTRILPYAEQLIALLKSEALAVEVNFARNGLGINGSLAINLKDFAIGGTVSVSYEDISKTVDLAFIDRELYLAIDDLKLKASVETIEELLKAILGDEAGGLPELNFDTETILEKLLSLDFSALLDISEADGTLSVAIHGTELLKALGIDLSLGDFTAEVTDGKVTLAVMGAELAISSGEPFIAAGLESYIDLAPVVPYVGTLKDLLGSETLHADLTYRTEVIEIAGAIDFAIQSGIRAQGNLSLGYGGETIAIGIGFENNTVYLDLRGIKVSGSVEEITKLLAGILPQSELGSEVGLEIGKLLETVFSEEFLKNFAVTEGDGMLSVTAKGTELLKIFGIDFALGDVVLSVTESGLYATALGAEVALTKGTGFEVEKEGYTRILPYVEQLVALFKGEAVAIEVAYAQNGIGVNGTLTVNLKDFAVFGSIGIGYRDLYKTAYIQYLDGSIYLALDGLKIKLDAASLQGLIGAEISPTGGIGDVMAVLGSLDFGKLLELSENGTQLDVILDGTELLKAFGLDFDLGDVSISVTGGKLLVEAYGVGLTVSASSPIDFESEIYRRYFSDLEAYSDISLLALQIPELIQAGAIALNGSVALQAGDTVIAVSLNGVVSWKNGLRVYLDLLLDVAGTKQRIQLHADENSISFAYGQVGAQIEFGEFETLDRALVELYYRVKAVVDEAFESNSPLPDGVESIFDLLKIVTASEAFGATHVGETDFIGILNSVVIGAPVSERGICTIGWKGFSIELQNGTQDSFLGIGISYEAKGFSVNGGISASVCREEVPEMPAVEYLEVVDFIEILDYVGATVEALAQQDITVSIAGKTVSVQDETVVCDVKGTVLYHSGKRFPFHIDTDGHSFYVNPDLYFYLDLQIVPVGTEKDGVYLELWALDYDENDELDFFISLSRFAPDHQKYEPVKFYASAGELMTILSDACVLLGINVNVLDQYLIGNWLQPETVQQLRAIGDMLKKSLGLEDLLKDLVGGAEVVSGNDSASAQQTQAYITSLIVNGESLSVSLNSSEIFGGENLKDLTITVTKTKDETGKSKLTGFALTNVYGNGATETTDVEIGISFAEIAQDSFGKPDLTGYTKIEAVGKLFEAFAKSATHSVETASGPAYALNRYYYINGKVTAGVYLSASSDKAMYEVNVDPFAVSVRIEDDGTVALNACLGYPAIVGLIEGGGTIDISVRDNMIYMRKIQTSKLKGLGSEILPVPIVTYRAMPVSVFMSDVMNQLAWMFNLSDSIKDKMTGGSGSSDSGTKETVDYGTLLKQYISGLSYVRKTRTDTNGSYLSDEWTLDLNGASLTDGVLGNIAVKLATDRNGYLRNFGLQTALNYGITVKINADLTFANPGNEVDCKVDDVTENMAYQLSTGMSKAIREAELAGWKDEAGNPKYVEGKRTKISYMIADRELDTQWVIVNSVTGEVYADLILPDLRGLSMAGYTLAWDLSEIKREDGTYHLDADTVIRAKYTPNSYTVTLYSEKPLPQFSAVPQYVEALGGDYYVLVTTYVYNQKFLLPDGTEYKFPEVDEAGWRVDAFYGSNGKAYRSVADCTDIYSDCYLTAKWERIGYTVIYEIDGVKYEQTAHYGDPFECPVSVEREGYDFLGWLNGDTLLTADAFEAMRVDASAKFVASYRAKSFTVRLESDRQIEGFVFVNGAWVKEIVHEYGTETQLPSELSVDGFFLDGFVFDLADGNEYAKTFVPESVLSDVRMYAKWSEIHYQIVFMADGVKIATQNYREGEVLKNLPAVPQKRGYTGEWLLGENYTVSGDDTVQAEYTANTYEIRVYSDYALEGFSAYGNGYVRTYSYEYDNAAQAVELPDGYRVPKYDFCGYYYTDQNGEAVFVSRIDNDIIDHTQLYLLWEDNTVTVTLYSDVQFAGSKWDASQNAYRALRVYNDEYAITDERKTDRFQQLGWWHCSADGEWEYVDDVKNYDGEVLWAIWIQNLTVTLTELTPENPNRWSTYSIRGEVSGGAPYGKGKEIFAAIGATETVTGKYYIYFTETKFDELKYGNEFVVNYDKDNDGVIDKDGIGSFGASGELSWSSFVSDGAKYGGTQITKTFAYTKNGVNLKVSTTNEAIASFAKYTVTYADEHGNVLGQAKDIRAALRVNSESSRFVDEVAPVEAPAKHGYTATWEHTEIRSNMTVYPVYAPNRYSVRFQSAEKIDGWNYDSVSGTYFIVRDMDYGAQIKLFEGNALISDEALLSGKPNPYTVTDGVNVIVLPSYNTGRKWTRFEISVNGAELYAYNTPDTVVYKSEVSYTLNGFGYGGMYEQTFENTFTLPTALDMKAEGYVFLGWYCKDGNAWRELKEIEYSRGQAITTEVEALWQKTALSITSFTGKRQGHNAGKYYDYTLKATWQAELVGAFASDATVTQQFVCDFNVSDKLTESKTTTEYQSDFFQVADTRTQYTKASVKVTMSYCDMDGNNVYSQSVEIKDRGFSVFTGELK